MAEKKELAFKVSLDLPFEDSVAKVTEALKEEGFGVLTEIDVKSTLKEKLDEDFRKYVILGACNPPFAHRALLTDLEVGLLLPCNVIVYEADDKKTAVSAINPIAALEVIENNGLKDIAVEVSEKLKSAIEKISKQ